MHEDLALAVGIGSLAALGAAVAAVRSARKHGDWDMTSTFVFFVGLLASLPEILQNLFSGRIERLDAFRRVEVGTLSGWAQQLHQATTLALLVGGFAFFASRCLAPRVSVNVVACFALLIWLLVLLSDGLNGHALFTPRKVALFAILLGSVVARRGRGGMLGAAAVGVLLALLGGLQALLHGGDVFRECRVDKCGVLGVLYTGVFLNENAYGLVLVLTIPFIWLTVRGWSRIPVTGFVAGSAFITGSRAVEIAVVAAVGVLLALRPRVEAPQVRPLAQSPAFSGRNAVGLVIAGTAVLAGLALPVLGLAPDSLTQRPRFWALALTTVRASPAYGLGGTGWEQLYQKGRIPKALSASLQNQWIDVLFAGGVLALAMFAGLLASMLIRRDPASLLLSSCVLTPLLVASLMERPWSFSISDSATFTLVACALLPVAVRPSDSPSRSHPWDSTSGATPRQAARLSRRIVTRGPGLVAVLRQRRTAR